MNDFSKTSKRCTEKIFFEVATPDERSSWSFSQFESAKEFDAEVKRLRAEGVEAKDLPNGKDAVRLKKHSTALQWAQKLEYQNQRKERPGIREHDKETVRNWKKKPGIQAELNRRERLRLQRDPDALERKRSRGRDRMRELRSDPSAVTWDDLPENRESRKKYIREYNVNRRKCDPTFLIISRLRSRLYTACDEAKAPKNWSATWTGLGTCGDLRAYIEGLFLEGMSWDNRSEWHIDHLMPFGADVVDLTMESHQAAVCHYTNLAPLWIIENLQKGNTYTEEAKANFLRLVKEFNRKILPEL